MLSKASSIVLCTWICMWHYFPGVALKLLLWSSVLLIFLEDIFMFSDTSFFHCPAETPFACVPSSTLAPYSVNRKSKENTVMLLWGKKTTSNNQLGADNRCSALLLTVSIFIALSQSTLQMLLMVIWCEKPHVVVQTANLTWNDEASIWGQKSVDQGPWVFRLFWDVLLVFKGILQENDNPKWSVQIFFLPMYFQGAFSDLLNFVFILTWDLHSAVWI